MYSVPSVLLCILIRVTSDYLRAYISRTISHTAQETGIMDIHCPRCGTEPRAADINLDRMVAKCYNCNAVYSIADQVPHSSPATAPRMDVPLPERMTLEQEPGGFVIKRR